MINQTENNFLDLSKLFSGETREIAFDLDALSFPDWDQEIAVSSLRFSGAAKEILDSHRLIGTVSGVFSAPCGRCLAPVESAFSIEIDFSIVTSLDDTMEDVVLAEGQKIDLGAVAEETVLLHLPFRLLCREDCKGLCPVCGKDMNLSPCDCDTKEIDPRLAGLKDFFKNKQDS